MQQKTSLMQSVAADPFCLRHKFLVFNLVGRNLKLKYRESALGYLWSILIPLSTAAIYYVAFKHIMKVPVPHYLAYIMSGVLPWAFFSQSITEGMESLRGNAHLLGKIPMPPHVFPYVGTITHLVTLTLSIPVILGAALFSGVSLGAPTLLMPICFALLFFLAYGFALIFSVGIVYFYDLKHIVSALMQLWFYATPIVYAEDMIPEKYRWLLHLNPAASLFIVLRDSIVRQTWPSPEHLLTALFWPLIVLLTGISVYKAFRSNLVEML